MQRIQFRNTILATLLISAGLTLSASAHAQAVDAGLSVGTLGIGPQVGFVLAPQTVDARLNFGTLSYSYSTTSNSVDYNGRLKLQNFGLLGDWHPWGGSFRLTGGLFYNDSRFDLTGHLATGQTYTVNGANYTAQPGDQASAHVTFNPVAPYLGFGWGDDSDAAGLHFTSDFGVMYQGTPSAQVSVTTQSAYQALANAYAQASQQKLQADLGNFQWYPVIQMGLVYRF